MRKKDQPRCSNCGGLRLTATKCGICGKEVCFNCMYVKWMHWNSEPAIRCEGCAKNNPAEFRKY